MANPIHSNIIKSGVKTWNDWRNENPDVIPDLRGLKLNQQDLFGINLKDANIKGVDFQGANLAYADLRNTRMGLTFFYSIFLHLSIFILSSLSGYTSTISGVMLSQFLGSILDSVKYQFYTPPILFIVVIINITALASIGYAIKINRLIDYMMFTAFIFIIIFVVSLSGIVEMIFEKETTYSFLFVFLIGSTCLLCGTLIGTLAATIALILSSGTANYICLIGILVVGPIIMFQGFDSTHLLIIAGMVGSIGVLCCAISINVKKFSPTALLFISGVFISAYSLISMHTSFFLLSLSWLFFFLPLYSKSSPMLSATGLLFIISMFTISYSVQFLYLPLSVAATLWLSFFFIMCSKGISKLSAIGVCLLSATWFLLRHDSTYFFLILGCSGMLTMFLSCIVYMCHDDFLSIYDTDFWILSGSGLIFLSLALCGIKSIVTLYSPGVYHYNGIVYGSGMFVTIILASYIAWHTSQEGKQFSELKRMVLFFITSKGTNFSKANLQNTRLDNSDMKNARFDSHTVLHKIRINMAKNIDYCYTFETFLADKKVRNLLIALKRNKQIDFMNVNLQNAHLVNAYLRGADLRSSDLDWADLSFSDITGAKLFATSRENWEIEGIKCEYVYWDEEGLVRMPPDRDFETGEFEKLYKQLPTFEYIFQQGLTPIDAFVINDIVEHIKGKHPEFELSLDSFHSRSKPHAKFTVIHKDFVDQAALEIKSGFETQIKVLEGQRDQLMHVIAMLTCNPHAQLVGAVEGIVQQLIDKPRIQANMIQGLNLVEHIDTLTQQGGDMGNDHISITTTSGDVAFAKDHAFAQINKTITESPNLPETLEAKLKDLTDAVQKMTQQMPNVQAKEVTQDLQTLTEEATKDAPRKKWYELSGKGIIEAATAVGAAGKPVIDLTREVMKLLGG